VCVCATQKARCDETGLRRGPLIAAPSRKYVLLAIRSARKSTCTLREWKPILSICNCEYLHDNLALAKRTFADSPCASDVTCYVLLSQIKRNPSQIIQYNIMSEREY